MGNDASRPMPQFSDKHVIAWENSGNCKYQQECAKFFKTLGIDKKYLNPKKDHCFCLECRKKDKKPNPKVFKRGKPPSDYVLPIGWTRFGIIPACSEQELSKYYETGHIAYHGTLSDTIKKIVLCGKLKFAGQKTYDGTTIEIRDNHIRDRVVILDDYKSKETGFELPVDSAVFMSPSIKYASYKNVYAVGKTYQGKTYKCCLELRILPTSYKKHRETVLKKDERDVIIIDEFVANNEIEWFTEKKITS